MRPPVKDRLGFDYDARARAQPAPRLRVDLRVRPGRPVRRAGRRRPDRPGHGRADERDRACPARGPMRAGIPVSDLAAGLYLAVGVLVALHERERTGTGRWVQTSLLESMIAMMDFQAARWTIDGEVPPQEGNHHPTMVPMGCFAIGRRLRQHRRAGRPAAARFCAGHRPARPARRPPLRHGRQAVGQPGRAERADRRRGCAPGPPPSGWPRSTRPACRAGRSYGMDEVFADPQVAHLGMVAAGRAPGARPARHHPQRGDDDRHAGHRPGARRPTGRAHRRGARRAGLSRRRDRRPPPPRRGHAPGDSGGPA